jgi:tRNA (guanine10-N2)-dimethyltransferase
LGRYLGSCELEELESAVSALELPEGSVCVRARKVEGSYPQVNTHDVVKRAGKVLSQTHAIDLTTPDLTVRALLSDKVQLFISEHEIDRKDFDRRKVAERPFFSPISLHPRYARALINLTGARRGDKVLDPFCGTGGIVLEAALLGMKAIGSDIDPEMVDGCRRNLEHFGVEAEVQGPTLGDVHPFSVRLVRWPPTLRMEGRPAPRRRTSNFFTAGGLWLRRKCCPREAGRGSSFPGRSLRRGWNCWKFTGSGFHRSLTRHYHIFIRR